MALPKKLKDLNLFSNGESWQGIVQSITLPTLTRKIEEWRGGGMDGAVGIDLGQDGLLTTQWTVGGLVDSLFDNFGTARIDADMLRMTGSYERDDIEDASAFKVVMRGRHTEIDMGAAAIENIKLQFSDANCNMRAIILTRRNGDQHRYSVTDRDAYSGVKAYWNATRGAERKTVLAGSGDNAKQLHPTYATEDNALAAARAEWQRIQRGLAEFELTLALGRADILPESPLTISGYKPQIDATA